MCEFNYKIKNNQVIINSVKPEYLETHKEIIIPEFIEGKPVTCLNNYSFNNCSNLKQIKIPESVLYIGVSAFEDCSNLSSIIIPNSIISIGNSAFSHCTNLTSINIPNNITYIGSSAFIGCPLLNYNEYNNVYYLGNETNPYLVLIKAKSKNIQFYDINKKCKFIQDSAFSDCTNLTNITIPDNVTYIGTFAFEDCTSLKNIIIPNCVNKIEAAAFYGCTNLTSITIPDNVTYIGEFAFENCTSLKNIIIPNCVIKIEPAAFYGCTNLTSITIPDNVTYIGESILKGCTSLEELTLPFIGKNKNSPQYIGYIFGAPSYDTQRDYIPKSLKKVIITNAYNFNENSFFKCEDIIIEKLS